MLRELCGAVRSSEWVEVNATLAAHTWSPSDYRAMVAAATQVNDWRGALSLLQRMEATAAAAVPDPAAYGHAIAACTKGTQPERALALLDRLRAAGQTPEVRSCNMVISSFAKSDYRRALLTLRSLPSRGVRPNTISFNAALSGCSRAKRWKVALQLLEEMEGRGAFPSDWLYSSGIDDLEFADVV